MHEPEIPKSNASVGRDPSSPVKVAVVQYEPSWFDVEAGVRKTIELIAEASKKGARLIAFPELWIPGYPNFIFAHTSKTIAKYHLEYFRNALEVTSDHMEKIRSAARQHNIIVILGYGERDGGSLFMAQTFIGPDGEVMLHRRKFKPTHTERVLFGDASGDCSTNVVQTPIGRVGGLQCFEHIQPLLKYNTFYQGEQIHVASWPALFPSVGEMPFFNTVDACSMATHVYAIEGGVFALLASQVQSQKGLRANGLDVFASEGDEAPHTMVEGGGFSEIIAPDGRTVAKTPSPTWQGLLYHELDFDEIYVAKQWVDCAGHYSRPDIFNLQVNSKVQRHCVVNGREEEFQHKMRFPQMGMATEQLTMPAADSNIKQKPETNGVAREASVRVD